MAIELAINDVLQVTVFSTLYEQRIMNTFKLQLQDLGTAFGLTLEQAADEIQTQLVSTTAQGNVVQRLRLLAGNDMTFDFVKYQRVLPTLTISTDRSLGLPGLNQDGNPHTANIAGVVQKTTETPGRKGRGSMHVAGIPSIHEDQGEWDVNAIALLADLGLALSTTITSSVNSSKWVPCIVNPKKVNPVVKPVTGFVVHDQVRVMRRRTVGVGI